MSKSPDKGRRGKRYASAAEALQGAVADGQTLAALACAAFPRR